MHIKNSYITKKIIIFTQDKNYNLYIELRNNSYFLINTMKICP